ncbi:MAG TPA: prepilin-type N-terminal cleavage/methylation domain-containing protein [Caulobacteraceae bacterium]|jgi:prepilin-type N-terminal cleavage/methylation domain-containing protein|nr:prepilin-type N-terminal cleavage/methylation domain-containing protein [Caulobacteraceae bacterium]
MAAKNRSLDGGTTLIESLVVLAIIGLTAAIGFPKLQQALAAVSRRETVSAVAAELRQARAYALRADRPTQFVIARDGRAYQGPGSREARTAWGVELRPVTGRAIGFFGDGSSTGGALWVSARGRSTLIRVAPATGAILVGGR